MYSERDMTRATAAQTTTDRRWENTKGDLRERCHPETKQKKKKFI